MDTAHGGRGFLALVMAQTSLLVRASDGVTVVQRLLSLPTPGLLVSCCFSSAATAMCWLTDPVPADAVQSAEQTGLLCPASSTPEDGVWLAVVSRGLSSCFKVDSAGTGGVLMLLKQSASPMCAVGRFALAADAYRWLASEAAGHLLEMLGDGAVADNAGTARQAPVMPRMPSTLAPSLGAFPSLSTSAASRRSVRGGTGPRDGDLPEPVIEPTRSPFAVWSAREAASAVAADDEPSGESSLPSHVLSSGIDGVAAGHSRLPSLRKRGARMYSGPWRAASAPGGVRGGRGSADAARDKQLTKRASLAGTPPASACFCGQRFCSCGPARKKSRLSESGGVPAALNPSGSAGEDARSTFSRAGISRFMAEGLRVWEQYDADAAMALALSSGVDQPRPATSLQKSPAPSPGAQTCAVRAGSPKAGRGTCKPASVADGGIDVARVAVPVTDVTGLLSPVGQCASSGTHRRQGGGPRDGAAQGPLGMLAAGGQWHKLYDRLAAERRSTFVTGGPGVGKSTFLRGFYKSLRAQWPHPGDVVIVAPTGSAAMTASGQTYHSFFGFPRDYRVQSKDPVMEAARLLKEERYRFISRRLAQVRVLLLDEVSMVAADKFDIMCELLRQSRPASSPACLIYTFGDFLQLGPLLGGALAFTSRAWRELFGMRMLELTLVHRQADAGFVRAIQDARFGVCSTDVASLMENRTVTDQQYEALRCSVLHLLPRHEDVERHNIACLNQLCGGVPPKEYVAVDSIEQDKDGASPAVDLTRVTEHSRNAALFDCVAPRRVPHCLGARVMLTSNMYLALGLYHGSIGHIASYKSSTTPVVRFENHVLPEGVGRGLHGVHDAGEDWLEVECPPVPYEGRIMSCPGAVAVRRQVPFALGWGITVHRSQSLSLSEAVLDIAQAFGPGMVNAAISRVGDPKRMYVKSFTGSRLFADPSAVNFYREGTRL